MNDHSQDRDLHPVPGFYLPKNSKAVSSYLLESQLLQHLKEAIDPADYPALHLQTGISLLAIEVAIEDRPFQLNKRQLEHALKLWQEGGILKLLPFLHTPSKTKLVQEQEEEKVAMIPVAEILDQYPYLELIGIDLAMVEQLAADHAIDSIYEHGTLKVRQDEVLALINIHPNQ